MKRAVVKTRRPKRVPDVEFRYGFPVVILPMIDRRKAPDAEPFAFEVFHPDALDCPNARSVRLETAIANAREMFDAYLRDLKSNGDKLPRAGVWLRSWPQASGQRLTGIEMLFAEIDANGRAERRSAPKRARGKKSEFIGFNGKKFKDRFFAFDVVELARRFQEAHPGIDVPDEDKLARLRQKGAYRSIVISLGMDDAER